MKKIFVSTVFAVLIIFGSAVEKVSAQDVWVGTSPTTGWQCYVMTETIRDVSGNQPRSTYQATLKMVTQSCNVKYLYYTFEEGFSRKVWYFSTSQGFKGKVDKYETPIEINALKVVVRYFGGELAEENLY